MECVGVFVEVVLRQLEVIECPSSHRGKNICVIDRLIGNSGHGEGLSKEVQKRTAMPRGHHIELFLSAPVLDHALGLY